MFQSFVDAILTGTFLVCREFSKLMALQRYGRIVNIGSIMTELHAPGTVAYASAKSAVVQLTKVMARELANSGVTCNVVSPSLVLTDSSEAFGPDWKAAMLAMQTIQRPIEIAELCNVVAFFASPASGCVTGQVVHTCLVD
jgi:3-oxoacyl-[acyl-carrier protein] reductase